MASIIEQLENAISGAEKVGSGPMLIKLVPDTKSNCVEVVIDMKNEQGVPVTLRRDLESTSNWNDVIDEIKHKYPEYFL